MTAEETALGFAAHVSRKQFRKVSKQSKKLDSDSLCKSFMPRQAPGVIRRHNLLIRSHIARVAGKLSAPETRVVPKMAAQMTFG